MKEFTLLFFKKIGQLILLLFFVSIFSFMLVSFSPIDPVQSYIGADMTRVSDAQREQIAEYWGLDQPKTSQYMTWAKNVVTGNFGTSLIYRTDVLNLVKDKFINSFLLMLIAWIISGVLGLALGIISGLKENKWLDYLVKNLSFLLASTPGFWIGLLLLILFSSVLGLFPIGLGAPAGVLHEDVTIFARLHHLILPALTLSIIGIPNIALHTREKLIDVYKSDFMRYARAKGKSEGKILKEHGLRHIVLPAISLHFASFSELFGGAVIIEQVFSYPGLGQAIVQAGLGGDVPLLLGAVLISAVFVYFGNIFADILYYIIDPRIKKGGSPYASQK